MGGKEEEKNIKKTAQSYLPLIQVANTIAYAPVVMWMSAAKQQREGGEHGWREGGLMRVEERAGWREEGASGENAVMTGQ